MVNVTITMSRQDYDYIVEELKRAEQNTYIKYIHEKLNKHEITERTNAANEQISHVLSKLLAD